MAIWPSDLALAASGLPHPQLGKAGGMKPELLKEARAGGQLALLYGCGKAVELKRLGCCRSCYDRRQHSLRFFGGLRERVIRRDGFAAGPAARSHASWFIIAPPTAKSARSLHSASAVTYGCIGAVVSPQAGVCAGTALDRAAHRRACSVAMPLQAVSGLASTKLYTGSLDRRSQV
jgi:hypothetical protein